jgi:hypothetical protein
MPKRVLDFDALWASDKLASCAEWAQSEYAWVYGLADASGSFEITNLRVIWGRVAAIRKNLTLERLQEVFDEFIARGLLFTWEVNGKRYGHWTGSDVPGRLPARSWRARLEKLAPPVPCEALAAYSARFGGSKEAMAAPGGAGSRGLRGGVGDERASELKHQLEEPQAQDLDLDWDEDLKREKEVCPPSPGTEKQRGTPEAEAQRPQNLRVPGTPRAPISDGVGERALGETSFEREKGRDGHGLFAHDNTKSAGQRESMPQLLLQIYDEERGELPEAGYLTPERRRRCARLAAAGFTWLKFQEAVRRAAATPFLTGDGTRGWQASFDWLINRHNLRKVLGGEYAPSGRARGGKSRTERRGPADLYAGAGPRPADCGVRVNPAALERIRARQARFACGDQRPALGAPEATPKLAACDAQPRASPAILKF